MNKYFVYAHENKINGKLYIGITGRNKPEDRWQNGRGYSGTLFGNAINKYGWENFNHIVLFSGLSKEEACQKEIQIIKDLHTQDRRYGYNIADGGQTGANKEMLRGFEDYRNSHKRKVILLNTMEIFDNIQEAEKATNVSNSNIIKVCKGERHTSGIMPNGEKMVWRYYQEDEDYFDAKAIVDFCQINKNFNYHSIKLVCLTTNEIFNSITEAENKYGVANSNICKACVGKYSYAGKLKDGRLLKWRYYFDYIKMSDEEIDKIKAADMKKQTKQIYCLEDNICFNSIKEASVYYNLKTYMSISSHLANKRKAVYVGENRRPIHFIVVSKRDEEVED